MYSNLLISSVLLLQLVFAWGVPAVISGLLIAFDSKSMPSEKQNPSFQYGNAQAAIAVFMLVMCFIGAYIVCLYLVYIYGSKHDDKPTV